MGAAALAIGHGGFGTTMTAAAAGVPQIVLPLFASDQFVNARRIEAVGAGRQLPGGPDDLGQLPAAVHALLSEARYAQSARTVADEIAALPDVSTTVDVLRRPWRSYPRPSWGTRKRRTGAGQGWSACRPLRSSSPP